MFDKFDYNSINQEYIIPWAINIFFAIVIFVVGRLVIKSMLGIIHKLLNKSNLDEMLTNFILSLLNILLMMFLIIAVLDRLGVQTTSLVAIFGAAGLAIGLSLQGTLQNFSAGVLIIIFKPFKIGDFVEVAGITGIVEKITIFNTVMKTLDNREITIPNGMVYGGVLINYSAKDTRRLDLVFGIGYDDDIKKAKEVLNKIINSDERILKDPAPLVAVGELGDSSINFNVRPWVKSEDYWDVRADLLERVKLEFDANDISIPYPQMDIHLDK
jgi:small conductance mechanosensitive channel